MTGMTVKTKEHKEKEQSKDTKDTKDHKDAKEHKDSKDKEGHLEKAHPDLSGKTEASHRAADLSATVDQLMQRLTAVEQQLATGQSFIVQDERPPVGLQAIEEPRQGLAS